MLPDMAACRVLAADGAPDIFLLVHYFGRPAVSAPSRDFCKQHACWLAEDAAHVLRPISGVGSSGDFVLYSPHKNLAIPDGAVLVVRPNGPGGLGDSVVKSIGVPGTWSGQLRELQEKMGVAENSCRAQARKWLLKRVLQKLGVHSLRRQTTPFMESLQAAQSAPALMTSSLPSAMGRRLLAGMVGELGQIARTRQRHQLMVDELTLGVRVPEGKAAISPAGRATGREWSPYLAAYCTNSVESAQRTYEALQDSGAPVTAWPDLPPEVIGDAGEHMAAMHLRHTRFYLPVHQSLSPGKVFGDAGRAGNTGTAGDGEVQDGRLRIAWNEQSAVQWQEHMIGAGRSSLLQAWAYGQAKAEAGWKVKRGVFYRGSQPVAFVQVLHKSITRIFQVSRINRGPLFVGPVSDREIGDVWTELASLGNVLRGRLLSAAPELSLSGANLALMYGLGFKQPSSGSWESVWIDLSVDISQLRRNLDGKWRNALVAAEKSGLSLELGADDDSFEWMMDRYKSLVAEKDFTGIPVELLMALRTHTPPESQLLVLRAMHDGQPVAGVCLARHGLAATYLLGWSGATGRHLKATQYLLWQAVVCLKQDGYEWFDLGGIDEDHTPGIAAFKLGMNGQRYESAGEYWKW